MIQKEEEKKGASTIKVINTKVLNTTVTNTSGLNFGFMSDLSALRYKLEAAEAGLIQDLHVPLKENSVQDCSKRLVRLQVYTNIASTGTLVPIVHFCDFFRID